MYLVTACYSLAGDNHRSRSAPMLLTGDAEKALKFIREGEAVNLFERIYESLMGNEKNDLKLSLFRLVPEQPTTFLNDGGSPSPDNLLMWALERRYPCGQYGGSEFWVDKTFAQQFRR